MASHFPYLSPPVHASPNASSKPYTDWFQTENHNIPPQYKAERSENKRQLSRLTQALQPKYHHAKFYTRKENTLPAGTKAKDASIPTPQTPSQTQQIPYNDATPPPPFMARHHTHDTRTRPIPLKAKRDSAFYPKPSDK